jgi:hypothetical protein
VQCRWALPFLFGHVRLRDESLIEFLALCEVLPRTGDGETVSAVLLETHWLDGCSHLGVA